MASSNGIRRAPFGATAIAGMLAVVIGVGASVYYAWVPCGEGGCVEDAVASAPPASLQRESEGDAAVATESALAESKPAPLVTEPEVAPPGSRVEPALPLQPS